MRSLVAAGLLVCAGVAPLAAQAPVALEGPWAAGLALGTGPVEVRTDQGRGGERSTFLMDFRVSRAVSERWRLGVQLGGWLLESGDVWDPSKGESVSQAGLYAQWFPWDAQPVFLESGVATAHYNNSAPGEFGTRGVGYGVGGGYALLLRSPLWATLSVHASGGRFGDVRNAVVTETGWRWSAFDLRVTGGWRFGRRPE